MRTFDRVLIAVVGLGAVVVCYGIMRDGRRAWLESQQTPSKPSSQPIRIKPLSDQQKPSESILASPRPSYGPIRLVPAIVTAYCPCKQCCGRWSKKDKTGRYINTTTSGVCIDRAEGGFVAAPRNVPFYSLVRIPGYDRGAWVPVLDRGGAIKIVDGKMKLDVFFWDHDQALLWGRRKLTVEIMDKEK